MYRALQVNNAKNIEIVTAAEDLTRGMAVYYDPATKMVGKTGAGDLCLLDVTPKYEGYNAVVTPNDSAFEEVKEGELVLKITMYHGEHHATNQIEGAEDLVAGDKLTVADGKLTKGDADAKFVFVGAYADPTFDDMYEVYVL